MAKPRSPELARSGHTAVDPDAPASTAPLEHDVGDAGTADHLGPVPPGNQPTRGGRTDEDKPDLAAFARRLGIRRRRDAASGTTTGATSDTAETDVATTGPDDAGPRSSLAHVSNAATAAMSLSLRTLEMVLRRSADTVAAVRRRVGSDDADT